jgi:protein-L-isoaspartate(D-aspartate) O-methyltransferase
MLSQGSDIAMLRKLVHPNTFFILGFLLFILASCGSTPDQITSTTSPPATRNFSDAEEAAFDQDRLAMVESTIVARGVGDEDILRAMRTVPRHRFVPDEYVNIAYADHPLPIGYGQTISQPFIVAWMTELLDLQPGERVLEIGTGSGYQAAVLAELGYVDVYSIEIVPQLAESATARLKTLGYDRVLVKQGDGYYGWEEYAPFDAIIVTAAPDHLPAPLAAQLAESGRLVIPIGPPGSYQSLWRFVNTEGELKAQNLGGVAFVPFTGGGIEQAPETPRRRP